MREYFILTLLTITALLPREVPAETIGSLPPTPRSFNLAGTKITISPENGAWAEGLIAYLTDFQSGDQKVRGWEFKKQLLIDYQSYVNDKSEYPLRQHRAASDPVSKAIGTGKSYMVFHMLRNAVGNEAFNGIIKTVFSEKETRQATWDDFKLAAEKIARQDMGPFFTQWLDEKGLPDLRLEDVTVKSSGTGFEVKFAIAQKTKPYVLSIPVMFSYMEGGDRIELIKPGKEKETFTFFLDKMPGLMALDRGYDIARVLSDDETPPTIGRLMADDKPLVVPPEDQEEPYKNIIDKFREKGAAEKSPGSVKDEDLKTSTIIVFGADNPLVKRLFGRLDPSGAGFELTVKANPMNARKVIGIIHAGSSEEAYAAFQKIPLLGEYSGATFSKGTVVSKKIEEARRGIIMELGEEAQVVDLSMLKPLSHVIEGVSGKKIVYVGEYHDRVSHHNVQARIIEGLYKKNGKIAIGMEMFQRPFQAALDEYTAGAIDEREFLKRSEYFKRWGFDYNLYKPILDFAREKKVPLIALNLRRELIDKVSKQGLDSLTDDEKKEIPKELDFSDKEYRNRIREVFDRHESREGKDFNFFFQSQILWDETMSLSIDEFMKKNPGRQIVVIAGGGHLAFGSGIPKRTFRRNGLDYAIVLSDADIEKDVADYVVYPKSLEGVTSPRLMATLKEDAGRVIITGLSEDSAARKAGLKKNDAIISLDSSAVASVEDLKLILFYKKAGDTVKVRAVRKRFLLGDKDLELDVHL